MDALFWVHNGTKSHLLMCTTEHSRICCVVTPFYRVPTRVYACVPAFLFIIESYFVFKNYCKVVGYMLQFIRMGFGSTLSLRKKGEIS